MAITLKERIERMRQMPYDHERRHEAEAIVEVMEAEKKKFARLLLEARDALPAISMASARLHRVDLTLAARIESALEEYRVVEP